MTRILLVRHGESEWNALGRWQGQADPPLTELGQRQALAAAAAVGLVDEIVSSDLQRARLTAEMIAQQLGLGPVMVDPDLREREAGEWAGLTRAEIHRDWPGYLPDDPASKGHDGTRRPPNWESDDSLLVRALAALARIEARVGDGDALAVTHGGLIYAIEGHLGESWHRLPNLGARWLTVDGRHLELGPRLVLVDPHDVTVTTPDQI